MGRIGDGGRKADGRKGEWGDGANERRTAKRRFQALRA
jgi:hypothetical protein